MYVEDISKKRRKSSALFVSFRLLFVAFCQKLQVVGRKIMKKVTVDDRV